MYWCWFHVCTDSPPSDAGCFTGAARDGVRMIFNILGPLTNPADAPNILMGVFDPDLVCIQAHVLHKLGAERALVVCGRDGMDELSLGTTTLVGELRGGRVREYEVSPEDYGMAVSPISNLQVESPAESREMLLNVLAGKPGPALDVVALNAGAALYVAGVAQDIGHGVVLASEVLFDGRARDILDQYVAFTRRAHYV